MSASFLGVYSATLVPGYGVQRIPNLGAFLPETAKLVRSRRLSSEIDSVAGWGFKPTAEEARRIARENGLTYLAIEDGFFRSVGHGESGAPAISLVADDLGIYYDAHGPSRLETILNMSGWESPDLLERAQRGVEQIVVAGLSKTNTDPPIAKDLLPPTRRRRVLVVDQILGDASISGALANVATFSAMLAAAKRDEPDAEIVVRRHPVAAAGLKQGCFQAHDLHGVTVLDQPARAADVLQRVDKVYTVSSLMGFDALLRGLPVRCFGLPFYAGWGLSTDEISCARRTRHRSLTELFAAACLLYARYVDPLTRKPCSFEVALERLLLFREQSDRNAGYTAAVGFSRWKRNTTRRLLASSQGSMEFHKDLQSADIAAQAQGGKIVAWGMNGDAGTTKAPLWRMEDGFVRSAGLGSDLVLAGSAILDDLNIYYDPCQPSRLEKILEDAQFDAVTLARARALRHQLIASGVTKYNVGQQRMQALPGNRQKVLVVGQVEDDRSVLLGSPAVRSNLALLEAVRNDLPDALLLYKPHPDVALGTRKGRLDSDATDKLADVILEGVDMASCLRGVDMVATMTSLAGFEALLRGVRVRTYGLPFYAGWGLTDDQERLVRRTRKLTLDELVAGALLVYTSYIDPVSGLPCPPEYLIDHLTRAKPPMPRPRIVRYLSGLLEGFRPYRPISF